MIVLVRLIWPTSHRKRCVYFEDKLRRFDDEMNDETTQLRMIT